MLKRLYLADVGGEPASGGRRIRTGLLYRSSAIHARVLRPGDLDRLRALGLRQIIDLREPALAARRPDALTAESVTYLPVGFSMLETVRPRDALLRRVDWQALAHPGLYAQVLEENKRCFGQFLDLLIDKPGPTLVHCTAGKDRTGMMVAVLDLALGVPRERIVARYMSVLPHLRAYFPRRVKALVRVFGGPPLAYSVMPEYMEGLLDHIGSRYGGPAGFLQSAGFARNEELKARFLE
jgi:protein-tyrosine phosphatase